MSLRIRSIAGASLTLAILAPPSADAASARTPCYGPDAYGRRYCAHDLGAPQQPPAHHDAAPAPAAEAPHGLHASPPTGFR